MDRIQLQKLRDLPIEGVAERLGLRVVRHKALCPFHDDHHASLSFKVSKNTWRCFVCGASGGTIDLVMRHLGMSFLEACRWLAGAPLLSPQKGEDWKRQMLDELAQSDCLWKQRMSIVCSWKTSQQGDPSYCLRYAEKHLHHPHDLMHKAVGWMLREMGKRVSMDLLRDFLAQHAHEMPRTALRYAIEQMNEDERKMWMMAK